MTEYGLESGPQRVSGGPREEPERSDQTPDTHRTYVLDTESIPEELRQLKQWVVWRRSGGHNDKEPWNARDPSRHASSTDPMTWSSFAEAFAAVENGFAHGVGFVLAADDPYTLLDWDDVLDDAGEISDDMKALLDRFPSYTEISMSGHGLHTIVQGRKPGTACDGPRGELYDRSRYVAMTGILWGDSTAIADCQEALNELYEEEFGDAGIGAPPVSATEPLDPAQLHEEAARAARALDRLDPERAHDYASWLYVGFALQKLGAIGLALWDQWSRTCPEKYQPECCAAKWPTMSAREGITLGSLYFWAQQDSPQTAEGVSVPPLPASAQLDPELGADACPWLDQYIAWSRHWSPRSYSDYHENCGLVVLSIVAARRVAVPFGELAYTNVYVMNAGRSSLYAKTTAMRKVTGILDAAGLRGLLAPDDVTPERLLADMGGYLDAESQPTYPMVRIHGERDEEQELRRAYAPQRGWIHNEFGRLMSGLARGSGYYSQFRGIIRELDDCPERYDVARLGRSCDHLRSPYLVILGSLTPTDLRGLGPGLADLLTDGFLARFAISCPPEGYPVSLAEFPREAYAVPGELVDGLRAWHDRLPKAEYNIDAPTNDNGKPTRPARVINHPVAPKIVTLGDAAHERLYLYANGLTKVVASRGESLLDPSYARLPGRALRVAALLASVSGKSTIELQHWARAQAIAERWRASLHHLWDQIRGDKEEDPALRLQERILKAHQEAGEPKTMRDITRNWRTVERENVVKAYEALVATGELIVIKTARTTKYEVPEKVEE